MPQLCVFVAAWDICETVDVSASVTQKPHERQFLSAVTRPVGFPALWLHGTSQHYG